MPIVTQEGGWRLDRGIGLALIGGFMLQFAYVVAWGAGLNARVGALEHDGPSISAQITRLDGAREDAMRALQKLTDSVDALNRTLDERTKKFDQIQESLERIERAQNGRTRSVPPP